MSYYAGFKAPEENMKKYNVGNFFGKPWTQLELLFYCLHPKKEKFSERYYDVLGLLTSIEQDVINDTYRSTYCNWKKEKGEVWFAGREYSRPSDLTQDELRESTLESLLKMTEVISTPDWFDENEKFSDKYMEIKGDIEYFVEETRSIAEHSIIEDLDDSGAEKIGDNKNPEENAD